MYNVYINRVCMEMKPLISRNVYKILFVLCMSLHVNNLDYNNFNLFQFITIYYNLCV